MNGYLSAADVRRNLRRAIEQFSEHVGPETVATTTLTMRVPPDVQRAAEILAVDLAAVLDDAATEIGWRRWRLRPA